MLIENFEARYHLGVESMDHTHLEFIDLVNRLGDAAKPEFICLFAELLAHTEAHFDAEYRQMQESAFPAIREHGDEHQRVLGELRRINDRVQSGSIQIGRAYVSEQLPTWFHLHAVTMDSALAAHLKKSQPEALKQAR